eukprot:1924414-Amphidinium_carterae.1
MENASSCDSQIFEGLKLPGYDAASDSIVTLSESLVTEDSTITWATWPNYPNQHLVTVTNNVEQTTWHYQRQDMTINLCWNGTYSTDTPMEESDWHIVYLGEAQREERSIEHLGQRYTIPASTNRIFRVRSNNDTSEKWIDYEDVSTTMMPQRVFMHMAREGHFEIEELITLEIEEMDKSHADDLVEAHLAPLTCTHPHHNSMAQQGYPEMRDPYHESLETLQFFARELIADPDSEALTDSSWAYALDNFNETVVEAYNNDSRKLFQSRKCGRSSDHQDFYIPLWLAGDCVSVEIESTHGMCVTVSTGGDSSKYKTHGWSVDGAILVGQCAQPWFSASGSVTLSYSASVSAGQSFNAYIALGGHITSTVGIFEYTYGAHHCPARRRLLENGTDEADWDVSESAMSLENLEHDEP